MTTATVKMTKSDLMAPPVAQTMQQRSLVIGVIGAIASVAGAFLAPDSFYSAYLTGFMFWLGLSLGCMAILMLYHLVGGAWGTVIRRILESGMMTLPLMFVLFIPILLNLPKLYFWARPENWLTDPKIAGDRAQLSQLQRHPAALHPLLRHLDRDGVLPESLVHRAGLDCGPEHAAFPRHEFDWAGHLLAHDFVCCD